ncbi:MAG TPA: S-layer homology domain-containing protein [Acidimicrobiales bacterium]|nr:S-layer homology domain-containing protein [Acidimicrobiales bacterium]
MRARILLVTVFAVIGASITSTAAGAAPSPHAVRTDAFGSPTPQSAPPGAHLRYFNGPVMAHVSVQSLYYGAGTYQAGAGPGESTMTEYFRNVLNSPYVDWLTEYNTPNQSIGRGSYRGQTTITPSNANNGSTIDDVNLQAELAAQLDSGGVPPSQLDGGFVKTVYAIFLPRGKTITQGGATGGEPNGFCAYHGTISHNGVPIPYMVLPDFDDPAHRYNVGCGHDPTLLNNFFSVTSHELIESVTDPNIGIANNDPVGIIGWYDLANGEIGDICAPQQGTVTGGNGATLVVQLEFSNTVNDCIATRPGVAALKAPGFGSACRNAAPSAPSGFSDAGLAADCLRLYSIALGKADGSFGENDPLLRSQVSSLLARLTTLAGSTLGTRGTFPDVTPDTIPNAQVRDEIELLAGSGIIAGFPDGLFHPADNLTVAQAITLVVRTLAFVHAGTPAAPAFQDQGSTGSNYDYAVNVGLLDLQAGNQSGFEYAHQTADTTARGLLGDAIAQGLQRLVDSGVVASR